MPFCRIRRRVEVQRCPAVPTAPNRTARRARSRSASSSTITALFPPSSRIERAVRFASAVATRSPRAQDPVAWISGTSGLATSASPTSRPEPTTRLNTPSPSVPRVTSSTIFWTAIEMSGVRLDGFQTTVSPQTRESAHPQPGTATGKLNAEMMPTTPSGCQRSIRRWSVRSEAMSRP